MTSRVFGVDDGDAHPHDGGDVSGDMPFVRRVHGVSIRDHAARHAVGGDDEITELGTHAARHASGGGDAVDHGGLDGLADDDHAFYPKGELGYAEVTSNQGTITTEADLTGLAATVTVAADRRIRITGSIRVGATNVDNAAVLRIKESTTVLGIGELVASRISSQANPSLEKSVILASPSAGSHTYKLSLQMSVGTGSVQLTAGSTSPAFILVEDIGPA